MTLVTFISGQTVCLYGTYQEVTGGLGHVKRVGRGQILGFAVSGANVMAWYYLPGRNTR